MASSLGRSELKARSGPQPQPRIRLATEPFGIDGQSSPPHSCVLKTNGFVHNLSQVLSSLTCSPPARREPSNMRRHVPCIRSRCSHVKRLFQR